MAANLKNIPEPPGLVGSITARAEAQILRLSLTYALLDGSPVIELPHLEAAAALWDFSAASVEHVFGTTTIGDLIADTLLSAARAAYPHGLDRTAQSGLFGRNQDRDRLQAARDRLVGLGLAHENPEKPAGLKGANRHVFDAVPKSAPVRVSA